MVNIGGGSSGAGGAVRPFFPLDPPNQAPPKKPLAPPVGDQKDKKPCP